MGAFATMTFGCPGSKGGIAAELRGPADEGVIIGLEDARRPGAYQCFPFFDASDASAAADYDIEGLSDHRHPPALFHFGDHEIERQMGPSVDTWTAGDLTARIYSPVRPIPDPESADQEAVRQAVVPALIVELIADNRNGQRPRKVFMGYSGQDRTRQMRCWSDENMTALGQGTKTGIATQEPGAYSGVAFQPEAVLNPRFPENLAFTLGQVGLVVATVAPGEVKTIRFAVGFYSHGPTTTGQVCHYLYQRHFQSLEDVLAYALANADAIIEGSASLDERIESTLGADRAAHFSHAVRSYCGNTQLLTQADGKPLWVVNEGEYRMMNTFDLTVDQVYFELALNPWVVRNVLDEYVRRYSYEDDVRFPDGPELYPGGIAFTHDMGVANHFSPEGRSCYEQAGLRGVFSFMSCEELVNWVLTACLYISHTRDRNWLKGMQSTLARAVQSLANRDHPDPAQRNGVMGLDSSMCQGGAEITTYDSLDKSLGQARNNLYLAVKTWAAYALIEEHLRTLGDTINAELARTQATRCAATIVASADSNGLLPAVLGEGNDARIIPAIEGLIFPYVAGRTELLSPDGSYGALCRALERHFDAVMKPGVCKFADGGWKLSSTSRNSWLSKIYLCQFIAEKILGKQPDREADAAHWNWLMDEDNAYFAWSDQMLEGRAHGSRYYPRGVTSALWLAQGDSPLNTIRETLVGRASAPEFA